MPNNRKSRRTVVNRIGWIVVGLRTYECLIADVSESGAGLVTDAEQDIPLSFELLFTRDGSVKRQCFVVWRVKNQIGVQFMNRTPVGKGHL